jgi:hypothetical protein
MNVIDSKVLHPDMVSKQRTGDEIRLQLDAPIAVDLACKGGLRRDRSMGEVEGDLDKEGIVL